MCKQTVKLIITKHSPRSRVLNKLTSEIFCRANQGEFTALFSSMRPGGLGQLVNIWKGNIG
ncbi:hypothetical protein HanIR_Chr03g0114181 [Helianthus annuus]|nr:hypothetical protein HanIR_Chr03g0114181 [Helianthus annuus]